MSIHISIGRIENFNLGSETTPVIEEMGRGVSPDILEDLGHNDVPEVVPETPTQFEVDEERLQGILARYTKADIDLTTRANFLRNVVMHTDNARRLEGFQTNHQRQPINRDTLNSKQHRERQMADESLQLACGACALRPNCAIAGNIERWLDVHPYKRGAAGRKRPGSSPVVQTESREAFIEALTEDKTIHCEPQKRPKRAKN